MPAETDDQEQQKWLCNRCIGESFLRAMVLKDGAVRACSYCGKRRRAMTVEDISYQFETMFEEHYKESSPDPMFGQAGDPVLDIIQNTGEIDLEPATDIQDAIDERTYNHVIAKDGGDQRFGNDNYYTEKDVADWSHQADWQRFEQTIKRESRYFNAEAASILKGIFEDLETYSGLEGKRLIVTAGPNTNLPALYRARVFQSDGPLEAALAHPDKELGPPPSNAALAGRMNARGVPVFYGATIPDVAVVEVRPPVGSRVAVAKFELLRPMLLLDVGALSSVVVRGSLFDSTLLPRMEKARFFESLSRRISMPVMPNDEPMDYLITQAIADYLASLEAPSLDGIMYPSAQGETDHANVALFNKSSRVEAAIDEEAELHVILEFSTEDGPEPYYSVTEKTPPKRRVLRASRFPRFNSDLMSRLSADSRTASLRVVKQAIHIRHVKGVSYEADPHNVDWRIEKARRKRPKKRRFGSFSF